MHWKYKSIDSFWLSILKGLAGLLEKPSPGMTSHFPKGWDHIIQINGRSPNAICLGDSEVACYSSSV